MNTAALQNSKQNTAETVISARSLRQVFSTRAAGTVVAVNSIDLTVKRGEIIALLGPNGAGKTTLIDMILGLTQPSGGELSVFGRNASEGTRRSTRCGSADWWPAQGPDDSRHGRDDCRPVPQAY